MIPSQATSPKTFMNHFAITMPSSLSWALRWPRPQINQRNQLTQY
jgi:hypothetical protein